jgi:hypothetical protein
MSSAAGLDEMNARISLGRVFLLITVTAIVIWLLRGFRDTSFIAGVTDPWIFLANSLLGTSIDRIPVARGEVQDLFQLVGWITGGTTVVVLCIALSAGLVKWWKVTGTKSNGQRP